MKDNAWQDKPLEYRFYSSIKPFPNLAPKIIFETSWFKITTCLNPGPEAVCEKCVFVKVNFSTDSFFWKMKNEPVQRIAKNWNDFSLWALF